MLSKLADWGVSVVLGLALGAAIVVGVSSLAGVQWFDLGGTGVDGWYIYTENGPEPFEHVRGTEGLPVDVNVSRADVKASNYPGTLGLSGRYTNPIPADRPFELRFAGQGNVSYMTAGFYLPWYYDGPRNQPPTPGNMTNVACDVEEPENRTETYPEGRIVVNVTPSTCRFTVDLDKPLDLPASGNPGGEEIRMATTWRSDAGMRFQARWLEAR